MNVQELQARFSVCQAEIAPLLALTSPSDEQLAQAEALNTEMGEIQTKIDTAQSAANRLSALRTSQEGLTQWASTVPPSPAMQALAMTGNPQSTQLAGRQSNTIIPASVRRYTPKHFSDRDGLRADERAFGFGMWLSATLSGNQSARNWCRDHGVELQVMRGDRVTNLVHNEIVNTQGGLAG